MAAWISTWNSLSFLFKHCRLSCPLIKTGREEHTTERENPSLNGQLVPPMPCPHGKNRFRMVAVLNKAECRPRRRAPPQISPGTFLSSCHWIRACLSGRATGGLPRSHVSHQSSPADLLAAGLNMADASIIAPHPSTPVAFFPLCSFSSYHVSFSQPATGADLKDGGMLGS